VFNEAHWEHHNQTLALKTNKHNNSDISSSNKNNDGATESTNETKHMTTATRNTAQSTHQSPSKITLHQNHITITPTTPHTNPNNSKHSPQHLFYSTPLVACAYR
jgi:hypothetical protein